MTFWKSPTRTLFCIAGWAAVSATNVALAQENAAQALTPDAALAAVQINQVAFSGNRTFTSDQLSGLIASEIGKPLTLKDMQALAAKVEAFYHQSGYQLVRVVVPSQDFTRAQALQLVVLEGWLGDIRIQGNQRYADERITAVLEAGGIERQQTFTLSQMERALTRINQQSGVEVSSTLQPGQETGSTDMIIDVTEAPRVQGSVELNNFGSENTGEYRLMPSVSLANLTGRGDVLNALAMTSIGEGDLWFGYVGYETPINARGTKAHAYYSQGNVDVGQEFQVLEIQGDNQSWGLGVSQDYIRSARSILGAEFWLESQDLEQSMLDTVTSEDKIRKVRARVSLDNTDLNGRTLASLDLHQGLGEMLGAMDSESELSSRSYAEADNDFTKLSFDVARIQRVTPRIVVIPRLNGQFAFDSLVSSEQWAIGGFSSVAGHVASAYSGDHGFTASVEGRYSLFNDSDRYQLVSRLDHGQIFIKKPYLDQDDSQKLSGFAFGVQARPMEKVELRLDWATPLGEKTEDSSYIYAQARYRF